MIYWVKDAVYILRLYDEKSIKCSLFRLNSVKNFKFVLQTSIGNETAIKHICETPSIFSSTRNSVYVDGKRINFVCIDSDSSWRIMPDIF